MRDKKTLKERLQALTYMQIVMILFGTAFVITVLCITLSITSGGTLGLFMAGCGLAAFIISLVGIGITLYGHFAVGIEGRISWKLGIITNSILAVIIAGLYILGLTLG